MFMRSNEDIERWKPMHKYWRHAWPDDEPRPVVSTTCQHNHHEWCSVKNCGCDCHKGKS